MRPYIGDRPVIAFDNPGNGESDACIDTIDSGNYAAVLNAALDSLGIDGVDVIGRYSGGPVAMEMAFQSPRRVKHIVQAAVSLYEGEEQERLLVHYTPSIAPRWDGSHLMTAWAVMRDQSLYWPWFSQTAKGILWNDGAIDVALTDLRVREMLKCGDRYQQAYAAMWRYPMRDKLPQLKVPACFAIQHGNRSAILRLLPMLPRRTCKRWNCPPRWPTGAVCSTPSLPPLDVPAARPKITVSAAPHWAACQTGAG